MIDAVFHMVYSLCKNMKKEKVFYFTAQLRNEIELMCYFRNVNEKHIFVLRNINAVCNAQRENITFRIHID